MYRPGRIMPVSILAISSGAATAVRTVNASMRVSIVRQPAHVGEASEHGGGGDHGGTHDVSERAAALSSLEVAIGGGGAALAGRHQLAVRAVAHRAAGIAPLEAGGDEDAIEPLGFGL